MQTCIVFRDFMTLVWDASGDLYEAYSDAVSTAHDAFQAQLIPTQEESTKIAVFPDKSWAYVTPSSVEDLSH